MPSPDNGVQNPASSSARGAGEEPGLSARLMHLAREVRRFARGILGSDAYDRYLAHHRVSGCTAPPMTEREFWRDRHDRQDRNPEGRCC